MSNPCIEIRSDGLKSELFINGKKTDDVVRIQFDHEAGCFPKLTVEYSVTNHSGRASELRSDVK